MLTISLSRARIAQFGLNLQIKLVHNERAIIIMKKLFNLIKEHYITIYKFFLLIITISLIVLLYPKVGQFKYAYQQGKPWMYSDLIAPYDIPVYKTDELLKKEKEEALKKLKDG